MPKHFEVSGPAAIVLTVRDVATAAAFYEKQLGFRRDPEVFPNGGVGFLTKPSSFAVIQAPPGVGLESLHRPIRVPAIWFKTTDSQAVHSALVEAGVTILRPLSDGRFGQQFTFVDLDGYAITIYDRDAPAEGWDHSGA